MKCEIPGIAKIDKLFYCTVRVVYDCTLYLRTAVHSYTLQSHYNVQFTALIHVTLYESTEVRKYFRKYHTSVQDLRARRTRARGRRAGRRRTTLSDELRWYAGRRCGGTVRDVG